MTLTFWSSCLHLPRVWITGTCHHTRFLWCWELNLHFEHARQVLYQMSSIVSPKRRYESDEKRHGCLSLSCTSTFLSFVSLPIASLEMLVFKCAQVLGVPLSRRGGCTAHSCMGDLCRCLCRNSPNYFGAEGTPHKVSMNTAYAWNGWVGAQPPVIFTLWDDGWV